MKKVEDSKIFHYWKKAKLDDCDSTVVEAVVHPDFYEENGTPICECGMDFEYDHTEIEE